MCVTLGWHCPSADAEACEFFYDNVKVGHGTTGLESLVKRLNAASEQVVIVLYTPAGQGPVTSEDIVSVSSRVPPIDDDWVVVRAKPPGPAELQVAFEQAISRRWSAFAEFPTTSTWKVVFVRDWSQGTQFEVNGKVANERAAIIALKETVAASNAVILVWDVTEGHRTDSVKPAWHDVYHQSQFYLGKKFDLLSINRAGPVSEYQRPRKPDGAKKELDDTTSK